MFLQSLTFCWFCQFEGEGDYKILQWRRKGTIAIIWIKDNNYNDDNNSGWDYYYYYYYRNKVKII